MPPPRMPRPRKRTLLMVLLLLTGGAIINVAVAWGCHLASRGVLYVQGNTWQPSLEDVIAWQMRAPAGFPNRPAGVWEAKRFGNAQTFMYADPPTSTTNTLGDNGGWSKSGWPMHSLEGEVWIDRRAGKIIARDTWVPPVSWIDTWLPVRLIPPGFAINTVFYAAMLWPLLAIPGFVRRRIRVRRGQCPACAYPIGTSTVCTECGKPVTPRA